MTQIGSDATPAGAMPTLFEAIVRQRAVRATYNRGEVILAPHILYTRHGEVYTDAVTLTRDGKPPREVKLGTFKVDGLGEPELTGTEFGPSNLFEREAEKYAGATLLAVEAS